MMPFLRLFIGVTIALLVITPGSNATERIALIIGNDNYRTLPKLNNAVNDARSIEAKLKLLGWETILETDASRQKIGRALQNFETRASGADAALVFYAGHGIEFSGENYLVPADSNLLEEGDLRYEAIRVNDFLESMQRAGSRVNILILDSCRNNPLKKRVRGIRRGLSIQTLPENIRGTVIMYAAAPGQAAEDGPVDGNGVFTGELLKSLSLKDLTLGAVFGNTLSAVAKRTQNRQRPWKSSSIDERNFSFGPPKSKATKIEKLERVLGGLEFSEANLKALLKASLTKQITIVKPELNPIISIIKDIKTDKNKLWYQGVLFTDRNGVKLNDIKYKYYIYADTQILKSRNIGKQNIYKSLREKIIKIGLNPRRLDQSWLDEVEENEKNMVISEPFFDERILELWGLFPGIELRKEIVSKFEHNGIESILSNSIKNENSEMTIDLNLTQKIDVILKRHLKISKAKSIFSTLINASTFEIISINSLSRSGQKKDNNNWNDSINTLAEWGSLLKPLTYALGFETGEIRINQVFKKIEPLRVDRFTIRDYKQLKGNNLTLRNVFVYSSNIIPAKIGLGIGKERFEAGLRKFGFYDHIKIFPRTTTLFPHQMRDINVATISFGHGIAISQTHVARLYAAILNGGVIGDLKVFNKSSRCRKIGSICQSGTTRILSKRTSDYIRALLFESVQRGTGSRANVANLVVMGQTGTTEKMSSRGYKKHKLLSSFAAGFRIGKKDFVLALSVDEPVGSIKTFGFATGGWVAAPAVAEIAEMMMAVKRPRQ